MVVAGKRQRRPWRQTVTITRPAPRTDTTTTTTACGFPDPVHIDAEDTDVVRPALRHLADAGVYASRVLDRNGCYPPQFGIDALCTTIAATAAIADHLAPYAGDFWPTTRTTIQQAHGLLIEAGNLLDGARHTTILTVPGDGLIDSPDNRYHPPTVTWGDVAADVATHAT
jgi:hypothetical protein